MIQMDLLGKVTARSKEFFSNSRGSHGWDHTMRVYSLCIRIGEKESADMEILKLAAILHDIGREEEDASHGKICHAEKGAKLASGILRKFGVEEEKIERIAHCIESHRFRKKSIPNSKEAMVLSDADKLDAIGAVGIGRAFLFAGETGARLHNKEVDLEKTKEYSKEDTAYREYMFKLSKIRDKMLTAEGKLIAQERHKFMEEFFERLNKEVDGEL